MAKSGWRPVWDGEIPEVGTCQALGPFGAEQARGQRSFGLTPKSGMRIASVTGFWNSSGSGFLRSLKVEMEDALGGKRSEDSIGKQAKGMCSATLSLSPQDYIVGVEISYGVYWTKKVVDTVVLRTKYGVKHMLGPKPSSDDQTQVLDFAQQACFVAGFHGFCGDYLDSFGVFVAHPEPAADGSLSPFFTGEEIDWDNLSNQGDALSTTRRSSIARSRCGSGEFAGGAKTQALLIDVVDQVAAAVGPALMDAQIDAMQDPDVGASMTQDTGSRNGDVTLSYLDGAGCAMKYEAALGAIRSMSARCTTDETTVDAAAHKEVQSELATQKEQTAAAEQRAADAEAALAAVHSARKIASAADRVWEERLAALEAENAALNGALNAMKLEAMRLGMPETAAEALAEEKKRRVEMVCQAAVSLGGSESDLVKLRISFVGADGDVVGYVPRGNTGYVRTLTPESADGSVFRRVKQGGGMRPSPDGGLLYVEEVVLQIEDTDHPYTGQHLGLCYGSCAGYVAAETIWWYEPVGRQLLDPSSKLPLRAYYTGALFYAHAGSSSYLHANVDLELVP